MPYHINYEIGDKITHKKFGNGIICGVQYRLNSIANYHVYYYQHDAFMYNIHATIKKTEPATDESREEVHQILLTKMLIPAQDTTIRYWHIGDIFVHDNKAHIILDNGRLFDNKVRYHICRLDTNTFQYSTLDPFYLRRPATPKTIKKARNIVIEQFWTPAFS